MTDKERLERCDYMNFGPKGQNMTDILVWRSRRARKYPWVVLRSQIGKKTVERQCREPEEVLAIVDKWLEEAAE